MPIQTIAIQTIQYVETKYSIGGINNKQRLWYNGLVMDNNGRKRIGNGH